MKLQLGRNVGLLVRSAVGGLRDQSQMPGRSNGRTVLTPGFGGNDDGRYDMDVEAEPMKDHSHLAFSSLGTP